MDQLVSKDFTSSRDLSYRYFISDISKAEQKKPALFFLHGWPDSSALWQFTAPKFIDLGYRVIVPDLLGYGGSSKPADASLYGVGYICKDLAELLDSENIEQIIPVGHDWGSGVAQRMYLFFPDRCRGIVLLSVAYSPPLNGGEGGPQTVEQLNDMFEKIDGYRRFEYQSFFIQDDTAKIWEDNLESAWTAMHADLGTEAMKKMFCEPGYMREYITSNRQSGPLKPFAQNPAIRDAWIREMRENGMRGPFNWYHASWNGHHAAAEKDLPDGRAKVNVPMLYIYCDQDVVCLGKDILPHKEAGLLPDLTMHEVHSNHWVPYENAEEATGLMKAWLDEKGL